MEWFPSCQQLENNILLNTIDGVRGCWWGFLNERMASGARGTRSRRCSRARPVGTISWLRSQNIWISSMLYHYYINPASPAPPFSVQRFPLWPTTSPSLSGVHERLCSMNLGVMRRSWRGISTRRRRESEGPIETMTLVNCCFSLWIPRHPSIQFPPSAPGMEKCWSVLGWFLLVRTTT